MIGCWLLAQEVLYFAASARISSLRWSSMPTLRRRQRRSGFRGATFEPGRSKVRGAETDWHSHLLDEQPVSLVSKRTRQQNVDDMAMLRLLACESAGLSLVPPVVARGELDSGLLVAHHRIRQLRENFYAITPSRRFPNPVLRELLQKKSPLLAAKG